MQVPLNIPNILSLYRLFSFPFVLLLVFLDHLSLFTFFIWLNLTTDILDGYLARKLNQVTEAGTTLDGLADTGTYILAITGMFRFKYDELKPDIAWFYVFVGLFVAARLYSLIKFRRLFGYQTYAGKGSAYIHGIFFLVLFISGYYRWFYFTMIISGYIVFLEAILITAMLRESRSNIKGLWWLIKERVR